GPSRLAETCGRRSPMRFSASVRAAAVSTALLAAQPTSRAAQTTNVADPSGCPYRVVLRGPGSFTLTTNPNSPTIITSLVVTGTTSASRLSIEVPRSPDPDVYCGVILYSLTCDTPLGEFRAPRCDLEFDGADFAGGVDRITCGYVNGAIKVGPGRGRGFAPLRMTTGQIVAPVTCPKRALTLVCEQMNGGVIDAGAVILIRAKEIFGTVRAATR